MKKFLVMGFVAVLTVALMGGCAGKAQKGPSDQELISKLVADFKVAGEAKDLDKLMTLFSDKFSAPEYSDKQALEEYIRNALDMGYLEGAAIDTAQVKTEITKNEATTGPVELQASFGSALIDLTLAKEVTNWKIVGMDVQMY